MHRALRQREYDTGHNFSKYFFSLLQIFLAYFDHFYLLTDFT